ncbi:hypothetical protein [Paenibacillus xylanexedens]|uniref:hypothetical protein n=1 Tax=Paenibacillus xylanexedens TaxID=528191 RepID=UPI0011A3BA35|nr:hypothetical protein [Paenibacillus xylanexedens]
MNYMDYLSPQERLTYENALSTIEMIEELVSLRYENRELTKRLNERDKQIDGLYKNSIGQMGSLLSGLIGKTES